MKILDWLLGNWMSILGGIVILALCIYVGSLHTKIGMRDAKIGTLEAEVSTIKAEMKTKDAEIADWKKLYQIIGDKLAEQNESILDLKKKTEAAKKARIAADKKAALIVSKAKKTEESINAVMPSSADCDSELQAIEQMLKAAK